MLTITPRAFFTRSTNTHTTKRTKKVIEMTSSFFWPIIIRTAFTCTGPGLRRARRTVKHTYSDQLMSVPGGTLFHRQSDRTEIIVVGVVGQELHKNHSGVHIDPHFCHHVLEIEEGVVKSAP
jgi:hypothetical protein